ncbi:TetR/AcrR family transcriptional regulator [Afifella sp. YEN Y35]|uniref:TetR/AcrR family transcriptional regulator n=1 Tax=Afifella sp. YEN Y35 TaxID=3388337 RepID=UPI0039E06962
MPRRKSTPSLSDAKAGPAAPAAASSGASASGAKTSAKPRPSATTRERVLAAAERLLEKGEPAFSMRELAAEAGVSFATPFNQFGSKAAIMHALSAELIAAMHARLAAREPGGDAAARILAAVAIAASVMLERPAVNRVIMATLGAPEGHPGQVLALSRAYWARALGEAEGFSDPRCARETLPDQLAFTFRGILSFWTAGEISDAELRARTARAAAASLLGFAGPDLHDTFLRVLTRAEV